MNQNWDDFRFFLAVSRTRSFVAASMTLKVTHSTVSRRISALEEALHTQLFIRTEKGCRLTMAGEQLLPLAENFENTVMQLQTQISGKDNQLSGIVRIGSPDGLGTMFLAPRICAFQKMNPMLEIELIAVPMYYSLYKREVDILISLQKPTVQKIVGKKITHYRFGLFASKSYLLQRKPVSQLDDLAEHSIVGYIEDLMYDQRLRFLDDFYPGLTPSFRSSTILAQMNAIKSGAGIDVLPYFMAHAEPELISVLPEKYTEREFWIQVNPDSRQLARVRKTIDFIVDRMLLENTLFLSLQGD